MELRFLNNGNIQVDGARIIFRNFAGAPSQYNREGDRNFAMVIPDEETAERLTAEGWNVKVNPPRDEEEGPFMYLPIKVKFNARGPKVYLLTGEAHNLIDEEMIAMLDEIDILSVNMDIRPYDWEFGGKNGRAAYLSAMEVTQNIDRFAARYAEEESPEE